MGKLYDADGNEVEAFTAGELKTHPEMVKLQTALIEAEKKAAEGGKEMSEGQKTRLKQEAEAAKTALETFKTDMEKKMSDFQNSVFSGLKTKALNAFSKGDKDASEKINLKYESLMKTGEYTSDEAGITKAMADAATLVSGSRPAPNLMNNITSAGDRGENNPVNRGKEATEGEQALRKPLGITDEDVKKYGALVK